MQLFYPSPPNKAIKKEIVQIGPNTTAAGGNSTQISNEKKKIFLNVLQVILTHLSYNIHSKIFLCIYCKINISLNQLY